MSFPISIFLYLYYGFLFFWLIFSLVGIFHILKFGFKTFGTFFATFAYMAVSAIILFITFNFINQTDWTVQIMFGNLFDSKVIF